MGLEVTSATVGESLLPRAVGAAVRLADSPSSPSSGAKPPKSDPAGGRKNGALVLLPGLGPEVGAVERFNSWLTVGPEVGPMVLVTGEGVAVAGVGPNGSGWSVCSGALFAGDSVSCSLFGIWRRRGNVALHRWSAS